MFSNKSFYFLFIVGLLIVISSFILSIYQIKILLKSNEWVRHTYLTIDKNDQISLALNWAEISYLKLY